MLQQKTNDYIQTFMLDDKVSKASIKFFIHLIPFTEILPELTTTTSKLASKYGKSERQVRRYIRDLVIIHGYLHKKKNIDYSDPDKPVHVDSTYTLTTKTSRMLKQAKIHANGYPSVIFRNRS